MKHKFLSAMLLLSLSGISQYGVTDDDDDDDEVGAGTDKVVLCHNGKNSIRVGAPGLAAHLGHGDTEGYCGEGPGPGPGGLEDAAVVLMHCEPDGDSVEVTAFSSSVDFPDAPLNESVVGADCAAILAALLNEGLRVRAVTGETDYLLLGEVED